VGGVDWPASKAGAAGGGRGGRQKGTPAHLGADEGVLAGDVPVVEHEAVWVGGARVLEALVKHLAQPLRHRREAGLQDDVLRLAQLLQVPLLLALSARGRSGWRGAWRGAGALEQQGSCRGRAEGWAGGCEGDHERGGCGGCGGWLEVCVCVWRRGQGVHPATAAAVCWMHWCERRGGAAPGSCTPCVLHYRRAPPC
jgi:hypothetical protein